MAEVEKTSLALKGRDGKKTLYEKKSLTAGDVMKALECQEKMYAKDMTIRKQLEELISFNVELFDTKEVTRDSILAGLSNLEVFPSLNATVMDVLGYDETAETDEKK